MRTALPAPRLLAAPQRLLSGLTLIAGVIYLIPFVERGWVPIDEGMIGQAAERVALGQLPHVDYEEPYPGALTYLYAGVFKTAGIDVAHLRWATFVAALATLAILYVILRSYLRPVSAAIATFAALAWSFPNYFSSLPSWWILLCALAALWGVLRFIETERLFYAIAAGLAAGVAVTIKQTGVYIMPAVVMSLITAGATSRASIPRRWDAVVRVGAGLAAMSFVVLITRRHLGTGELIYLIAPIAASCLAFSVSDRMTDLSATLNWRAALAATAAAAIPAAILLAPYVAAGEVPALINGVFVLPQKRLEFTVAAMRPGTQIVAGVVALVWVFWTPRSLGVRELRLLEAARWTVAVAFALLALRVHIAYMFLWEAVRGAAALLPIVALWLMASKNVQQPKHRRALFASTAMLAWMSLGQFPFASPIYFCYVAPLALIAGVVAVQSAGHDQRLSDGPSLAVVLLYAVLCLNRGYVWNLGFFHAVQDLDTPLDLPRAHLNVANFEADRYRRVVGLVREHIGPGGLRAGPDAPDIYFLTGQFSPSGRLFDFFSQSESSSQGYDVSSWTAADVIVLFHGRRFSPPLPDTMVSRLRQEFPHGESVHLFEVRWR